MAAVFSIPHRPFSIEARSHLMMPDGIFDTCIFNQDIGCYIHNDSTEELNDISVFLEGAGDPQIKVSIEKRTKFFPVIQPNAAIFVSWLADFQMARPGKHLVSFRIATGKSSPTVRILKQIFVSKTTYDAAARQYRCEVPEGTLILRPPKVFGPEYDEKEERRLGPWIPVGIEATWIPRFPYEGQFGELPFHDPWWKVVAWVVAAAAALAAIIAHLTGHGHLEVGVGCDIDLVKGEVSCHPEINSSELTPAGVLSKIANGAMTVGLSDAKDAWRRGQELAKPERGAQTIAESLVAKFAYPGGPPVAGRPYKIDVDWTYTRSTTKGAITRRIQETVENTHVFDQVMVDAPKQVRLRHDPFRIIARFLNVDNMPYAGAELYALCLVRAPNGQPFVFQLVDDGIPPDEFAGDGLFTGELNLGNAAESVIGHGGNALGKWQVFIVAQDINRAEEGMAPEEAAKIIGGMILASPFKLKFGSGLCSALPDATVEVVAG